MILFSMVIGVIIGNFAHNVQQTFNTVRFHGVSVPISVGLLAMMWPILTKVQYETLPSIVFSRRLLAHVLISVGLNWIVGPLVMLGVAWASLPDLPTYRVGVIMVGLARCIAMVMIWNELAGGDANYCAILVVINSILQIILYSPYAILFINVIGGQGQPSIHVSYGNVAIAVLIYLGIPLAAGVATRYVVWMLTSKDFLERKFAPVFGLLSLIGLLYTIIVLFAYQGHHIVHNLGPVFRVFVPLILYFLIMWTLAFCMIYQIHQRRPCGFGGYQMAVVHSFTAGSNNFELAIAIAISVYGVGSDQALAATIGPLVEVPVLLSLTWVALYLERKLSWRRLCDNDELSACEGDEKIKV
ncbi:arsenical-resistance protein ACR3 [Auriscalpium vulgare]|uniref:Arsenical-resistance protein ACR3 n=1 Tax=Auriscalpium vulgare TaxID=40419 RepID=A0ACB8S7U5_9AGAM|nr:arsenical-resistance protein ACR3 [Auriscalpium vulgare]